MHSSPPAPLKNPKQISNKQLSFTDIINSICFELESNQVHQGDVDYLFSLAYQMILMISDLHLVTSNTQTQIMKEIISAPNQENVDISKLVQALDKNEDVQNLILLFSNTMSMQANRIEFKGVTSNSSLQTGDPLSNQTPNLAQKLSSGNPNMLNQAIQQRNQRNNDTLKTVGIVSNSDGVVGGLVTGVDGRLESRRGTEMNDGQRISAIGGADTSMTGGFDRVGAAVSGQLSNQQNSNPYGQGANNNKPFNEITTIDLMYSYNPQKASFQEDVVKGMTQRLKMLKKENKDSIDALDDASVNLMLAQLNQLQISHIDFYGQRQLTQIMKSLFTENKIQTSNYSIIQNSKEFVKANSQSYSSANPQANEVPINNNLRQEEQHLEKILSDQLSNAASPQRQSIHNNNTQLQNHTQTNNHQADIAGNYQDHLNQMSTSTQMFEAVNPSKVSQQMRAIFREYNAQYKPETKFTINTCFYKIIEHMLSTAESHLLINYQDSDMTIQDPFANNSQTQLTQQPNSRRKGHKLSLEMKKFQKLGEIGGLSFVMYEMTENDGKVSSDMLFQLAYECYDKLYQSAQSREILVKYIQLKNAKRTTQYWDMYWSGVIQKCKAAFQAFDCFKEIDYLKQVMDYAVSSQRDVQQLMKEITEHYNHLKRVILDFNYQLGKIRGFDFVIRIYKNDKERFTEDVRLRVSQLREQMEKIDVKLVSHLNEQLNIRRNYHLYFKTIGEDCFSKCIQKSLEPSCLVELMIIRLLYMNCWQLFISYMTHEKNEVSTHKLETQQSSQTNMKGQNLSQQQQLQQQQLLQQVQSLQQKEELEKVMLHIMKFQRIKEIDEKLMQDIKEDGVQGFDKFRAYTQRMAEEEEKQTLFFKTQTQVSHNPNLNSGAGAPGDKQAYIPIMERKGTFKNPILLHSDAKTVSHLQQNLSNPSQSSNQSSFKPKLSNKLQSVIYNQDLIENVNTVMDHEYTLASRPNKVQGLMDFTLTQVKELNYEMLNEFIVQKPDFEKHIKLSADFIELNLQSQDKNSPQKQITKLIGQHIYLTKLKQDLVNPLHVPMLNEKKSLAHNLLEHYLKALGTNMKSTRYQKQFKETRIEALQLFVKALRSINKLGRWNNFDLTSITGVRAGNLTMDQCFQTIVILQQYLKEKERRGLWKELVQIKDPQLAGNPTEGLFIGKGRVLFQDVKITEEMEQSQEYKTFNSLFHIMKGTQRLKIRTKEKIFKPMHKIVDYSSLQFQQQRLILNNLLSPENVTILESQSQLETYLTEQLFMLAEEDDISGLIQGFYRDKQVLFDRRKAKGMENYLVGVQNYLNSFNEGEQKSEIISRLQKEATRIMDQQLTENKGLRLQTAVSLFRESTDKLLKYLTKKDFLICLLNKVKKQPESLTSNPYGQRSNQQSHHQYILLYLQSKKQQCDRSIARVEKIQQYMKSNIMEDQEECLIQQIGAKDIHSILSRSDFVDEIGKPMSQLNNLSENAAFSGEGQLFQSNQMATNIFNSTSPTIIAQSIQPYQSEEQFIQQKTLQYMTQFVKKLAFLDDRLNTLQLLRNDQVYGFVQILRQRTIYRMRDKFRLREQYDEGLRHLLNIFQIYKTPITHYQKSYERVCRFIQRELVQRIVESDEGHLQFQFFEQISKKGSGVFKGVQNRLDVAFGKLEYEESQRLDVEKIKQSAKRDLDMQTRIFKEFIDLEDNNKVAFVKQQQLEHQNFRLTQEMAALLLLIRLFYMKLQQDESSGGGIGGFPPNYSPFVNDNNNMSLL